MASRILKKLARALVRLGGMGLNKGPHITRYAMYRRLARFAERRDPGEKVLSISGSEQLALLVGYGAEQVQDAAYPQTSMLSLPYRDGEFDAVVSDQVLEHVEGDPQRAIDECFRVLKPGGLLLCTSCFLNPVHGRPKDFWRFTADALRLLGQRHGEVLEADGWGNPRVFAYFQLDLRFEPIPHAAWHPLHRLAMDNDPRWPIVVWLVARKKPLLT